MTYIKKKGKGGRKKKTKTTNTTRQTQTTNKCVCVGGGGGGVGHDGFTETMFGGAPRSSFRCANSIIEKAHAAVHSKTLEKKLVAQTP